MTNESDESEGSEELNVTNESNVTDESEESNESDEPGVSDVDTRSAAELEPIRVTDHAESPSNKPASPAESSTEPEAIDDKSTGDAADAFAKPDATQPGLSPTARRFQNPLYRVMTMASASLVAVLGLSAAYVSRTLSPPVPMVWTTIDLIVTAVLFVWYALGMRCHLDFDEELVVVSTKTRTSTINRSKVESIDLDSGWWGAIQPSGRPVWLRLSDGRKVRGYGALPSDAIGQAKALADLQNEFGHPSDVAAAHVEERIAKKFGTED